MNRKSLPLPRRLCFHRCLSVCLLATLCKSFGSDLREIFSEGRPMNKHWLNFGGNSDHCLGKGIVLRIRHYWEIWKVVSTDCTVWHCSAWHALQHCHSNCEIITSPAHDSHDRRALVEVCTVPVLLVLTGLLRLSGVIYTKLECGPMPNLMVALPNIGGALCSMPQSLADAHY